jgi:hypothetical protein
VPDQARLQVRKEGCRLSWLVVRARRGFAGLYLVFINLLFQTFFSSCCSEEGLRLSGLGG